LCGLIRIDPGFAHPGVRTLTKLDRVYKKFLKKFFPSLKFLVSVTLTELEEVYKSNG
jgi:hypothetical protein